MSITEEDALWGDVEQSIADGAYKSLIAWWSDNCHLLLSYEDAREVWFETWIRSDH